MTRDTVASGVIENKVIIEGADTATGAEAVAPEARGRVLEVQTQYVPGEGIIDAVLQRRVETFLTRQAAWLDARDWQAFIDCFTNDGMYWMPVAPEQTSWETEPSIFAEDVLMMEIRKNRLQHPNAWSQAPLWGTNHMVGNVIIEQHQGDRVEVYSRFQMMEMRRDDVRHFGGTYRHTLVDDGNGFRIALQRVDLMNGRAAYDYVLQAWV